jgi:hypothetical protein
MERTKPGVDQSVWKVRTAGDFPFPPKGGGAAGPPVKRSIPSGHAYDPRALKPLSKMLWAMSVSLGHALTAYRQFTKLKSVTISPDGKLGGRGYVMTVVDVRKKLYEACEALSAISDTIHDEVNGPHWKPQLSQLDENDREDVQRFIDESQGLLDNPGEEAEKEMDAIEHENDAKWDKSPKGEHDDEPRSDVPGGGNHTTEESIFRPAEKTASVHAWKVCADSSVAPSTLPGPRVEHIGPSEEDNPFGAFNENDDPDPDDWAAKGGTGFSSEWSAKSDHRTADSTIPTETDVDTPTDADDFGIGYGQTGKGSKGYGTRAPDGRGVFGPASDLPSDPGGALRDRENSDAETTQGIANREVGIFTASELPNDFEPPVARSDYYHGPKGNTVSGQAAWKADSDFQADSEMPGDDTSTTYTMNRDTMGIGYTQTPVDNQYIRWDDSTKTERLDPTRRTER